MMRDERRRTKDEGRKTKDEGRDLKSSIVLANEVSDRPSFLRFKGGHPSSIVMILFVLSLSLSSCGYHISGTGGIVPAGAKTISVTVFFNATNEPYVDVEVTQAVVEEFMTDGRLAVVSLEDAELALRGKIVKYQLDALSYNPQSYVQQYRVKLMVEATLEDLRTKKVIWEEKRIESNFIADYAVTIGNVGATRVTKDAAIRKASQDIAWTLRSRILEGF
jgi:outer membrane lipopolysaccharide assembly protein LptE/RlpB